MHLIGYVFHIFLIVGSLTAGKGTSVRVYTEEGKSAALSCPQSTYASQIAWQGPPNYTQYTNGDIINFNLINKNRLKVSKEDGLHVLKIHNVTADDEGFYRCALIINGSVYEYDIHLLLKIEPSNISIANAINNTLTAVEGMLFNLSCTFRSGNMAENVTWMINGEKVEDDKDTFIQVVEKFSNTALLIYEFKPASTDKDNNYTCMVSTETIRLTNTVQLDVVYVPKVMIRAYPSWRILEGSTLSLECEIDANPITNIVMWYKDGVELNPTTEASPERYNVTAIDRTQAGVYRCRSFNEIGSSKADITVSVFFPPVINATYGYIGKSVKLVCLAEGVPQKYTFAKWEHLSFFGTHIRFLGVNLIGEYILPNVQYQDNGVYVCKAENGIRSADGQLLQEGRIELKVKGPPVFVSDNKQVQFGSNGQVGIISIYVYSYLAPTSLCCSTEQWKICQKTHPYYFEVDYAVVRDRFYDANILLHGYNIKFTTAILQSSDFKSYTFAVSNSFGTSRYVVDLKMNGNSEKTSVIKITDKVLSDNEVKLSLVTLISLVGAFLVLLVLSHVCSWYIRTKRSQMNVETSNYNALNMNSQYDEININVNAEQRNENESNLNPTCQPHFLLTSTKNQNVQNDSQISSSENSSNSGYNVISPEDIAEYLTPYSSLPKLLTGGNVNRTSQTFLKRPKSV